MATSGDAFGEGATEPQPGEPGYMERLGALMRDAPRPTTMQQYNVEEAAFWTHRHVPAGSVLEFLSMGEDGASPEGLVALLVTGRTSQPDGIWLEVNVLGAEEDATKKEMQKYFKGGRRQVHICYPGPDGACPQRDELGYHLKEFRWFPPGDYSGRFLNNYAMKKVKDGPGLELSEQGRSKGPSKEREAGNLEEPTETERRLAALRGTSPRVTFAEPPERRASTPPPGGEPGGRRAGVLRRPEATRAAPGTLVLDKVKTEMIDLTRGRSRSASRSQTRKKVRIGDALAQAALAQQQTRCKRESSRSQKKKKKKHKGKKKSSEDESSDSGSSTESSSLHPPLKRKSMKEPGSVFKMLEHQAYEFLAQDGVMDQERGEEDYGQRPKLVTYYQLALRPNLDVKSRDAKELALLCRALDLLREGRLDAMADMLAARLMAVETSTKQGWATARHLEIHPEEEGTTPAHVLLAAQKHGKQVEKAGGKGSWSQSQSWSGDWYGGGGKNKGKHKDGKGKGKKGKAKGKGGKGWESWGTPAGEKGDGKKGAEAAA